MFHKIKSVTPLANYRLLVHFTEGCCREYDMTPLIQRMPVFAPLRDVPGLFGQVRTDPGGYGVSFADATELWGLHESTLRKAVAYHKLVEGVDAQKYGKQWIVTRNAMEREYGPAPQR